MIATWVTNYLEKIIWALGNNLDDERYIPHRSVWKLNYNRHPEHLNPTLIATFGPINSFSHTTPQFACKLHVIDPLGVVERDFEAELRRTLIVEIGSDTYSATKSLRMLWASFFFCISLSLFKKRLDVDGHK